MGLWKPLMCLISDHFRRIQCRNRIFCIWINIPCSEWESVKGRAASWPLSRAENLLWQLSLMFVQAFCHQPVWALCRHQGCHGFRFYQWGNMQSDRLLLSIRNGREIIWVILSPHESDSTPCLVPCFHPFVALTYCTSAGMYSKAVVCSLLSLLHPQRSFVRGREGLAEGRKGAAARQVSKPHSCKTFSIMFGPWWFLCLLVCLLVLC